MRTQHHKGRRQQAQGRRRAPARLRLMVLWTLVGAGVVATPHAYAKAALPHVQADAAAVAAVLTRLGVSPIPSPVAAPEVTLSRLDQGLFRLSALRGQWVLLTFFATWCGPCASEMPSLQRLHQQRGSTGLAVVAIATDGDARLVQQYATARQLTLPIALDQAGRAAALYGANSVPLSFVIDPHGQLVGIAQGARDWASLLPQFDQLLALKPDDKATTLSSGAAPAAPAVPDGVASADGAAASAFAPPTAEVELDTVRPSVGKPFTVSVRVQWTGSSTDYMLHPPTLKLPAGLELLATTASTSSEAGRAQVTYHLRLLARQAGAFALDPIELSYTPSAQEQPSSQRLAGPTVQVEPVRWLALRPLTWAALLVGVAVAAGLAIAVRRWRCRRAEPCAASAAASAQVEALAERLAQAEAHRINGDYGAFLGELLAVAQALAEPEGSAAHAEWWGQTHALLVQVRYGGARPPNETLDQLARSLEKRLQARKSAPAAREWEYARPAMS